MHRVLERAAVIGALLSTTGLCSAALAQCDAARTIALDAGAGDLFGNGLAMSGDLLVVGATRWRDATLARTGAAYVFERVGLEWKERAVLAPDDGWNLDGFGQSVALDRDWIVAGSPFDDDAGTSSGSVYAFRRVNGAWQQTTKLVASDAGADAKFGWTVAVSGRLAVVGAPTALPLGAAYVFEETSSGWQERAKLVPSGTSAGGWFGAAVDIARGRVLVGAPGAAAGHGAAFVFERHGSDWVQSARLVANGGQSGDGFGSSIAGATVSDTIVVGAPSYDLSSVDIDSGAAYVFEIDPSFGTWKEVRTFSTPGLGWYLGRDVAIEEPFILLGTQHPINPTGARLFERRPDGKWPTTSGEFLNVGGHFGGSFDNGGFPVAMDARRVVVGANQDDLGAPDAGAFWALDLDPLGTPYCCPTLANSTGDWGRLRVFGSPVVADDDLQLVAGFLPPGNTGYFMASDGTGIVQTPGSFGLFCLAWGSALHRLRPPVLSTDQLDGGFGVSIGTRSVPGLGAIVPGRTWNFQAWYRDNTAGSSNFTDAVSVTFE